MGSNKESRDKKSKLTIPLHVTTPALKRTAEMENTHQMSLTEIGHGLIVQDDEGIRNVDKIQR